MTDDLSKEKTLIRKDAVKGATRLGRYTLGKRLGVGGMAEVYLAEQDGPQQFRKRVVVKRILASLAADPQFVQMFVREAQVAARLSHGNVVQILELGEHTDGNQTEYFIAMEYIDGLTLQRLAQSSWDQGKAVPVDVVLRACADAARGLHAAHTPVSYTHLLGTTPFQPVDVVAGTYTVKFVYNGREETRTVEVGAGATARAAVDFGG